MGPWLDSGPMNKPGEGRSQASRSKVSPSPTTIGQLKSTPPLALQARSFADLVAGFRRERESTLAAVLFGGDMELGLAGEPIIELPLFWIDGFRAEHWRAARPVKRFESLGIQLADDGNLMFGTLTVPAGDDMTLEAMTRNAYARLLSECRTRGRDHLLRVWNVVPRINVESGGLERYKRFCRSRAEAYAQHYGPEQMESFLPASSAVGGEGDDLSIQFLACSAPGRHVENPRQVSAYHYPPQYGPRSPSFARATVCPPEAGGLIFIAGTASIIGHESAHRDDLAGQFHETMRNITILMHAIDQRPCPGEEFGSRLAVLRVYLRRAEDWPVVSRLLSERIGTAAPVIALKADICRSELLLEIEGVIRPAG